MLRSILLNVFLQIFWRSWKTSSNKPCRSGHQWHSPGPRYESLWAIHCVLLQWDLPAEDTTETTVSTRTGNDLCLTLRIIHFWVHNLGMFWTFFEIRIRVTSTSPLRSLTWHLGTVGKYSCKCLLFPKNQSVWMCVWDWCPIQRMHTTLMSACHSLYSHLCGSSMTA